MKTPAPGAERAAQRTARRVSPTPFWLVLLAASIGAQTGQADEIGSSFHDDFSSFDQSRWYVSDGWSNGDHQNCLWSQSAVAPEEGRLSLYFFHDPTAAHNYRCGEIQSRARFGHGTYEARIRTNKGSGLNAAFFTYVGPVHGQRHDEIDFEILTANTLEVTVNTYVDGQPMHYAVHRLDRPANEHFHVYSFTWEPERLRWFVDGTLIHEVEDAIIPAVEQKIYFSIWGSDTLTDWMGPFVPPERPMRMDIDWVGFTALGEECHFPQSVLCQIPEN